MCVLFMINFKKQILPLYFYGHIPLPIRVRVRDKKENKLEEMDEFF